MAKEYFYFGPDGQVLKENSETSYTEYLRNYIKILEESILNFKKLTELCGKEKLPELVKEFRALAKEDETRLRILRDKLTYHYYDTYSEFDMKYLISLRG